MALKDLVRSAVSLANSITGDGGLQETVTLERYTGEDATGKPTYASALPLDALVSHSARKVRLDSGTEAVSTAQVTFLRAIPALSPAVTGREEPVDKRDRLTLDSGKSGPILRTDGGLHDPSTSRPYALQVFMG